MAHYQDWYHHNAKPFDVHVDYAFRFANAEDREAGENELDETGVTSSDVGKLALQIDNRSTWRLWGVDPLDWSPLDIQRVLREDRQVYVDFELGDNNNDGLTPETALASPRPAVEFLEGRKIVGCEYRVTFLNAGIVTDFPDDILLDLEAGAIVVFDASGVEPTVIYGPFTVDAVTPVGMPTQAGEATATLLEVAGDPWDQHEFYGMFVRMTSGNWEGYHLHIAASETGHVKVGSDWYGFAIGDTFEIVREPVVIQKNNKTHFKSTVRFESYSHAMLNFAGIRFEVDASTNPDPYAVSEALIFECLSVALSFCGVTSNDQFIILRLTDSALNFALMKDDLFVGGSFFSDIDSLSCSIVPYLGQNPEALFLFALQTEGKSLVSHCYVDGDLYFRGTEVNTDQVFATGASFWSAVVCWLGQSHFVRPAADPRACVSPTGQVNFYNFYAECAGVFIDNTNGAFTLGIQIEVQCGIGFRMLGGGMHKFSADNYITASDDDILFMSDGLAQSFPTSAGETVRASTPSSDDGSVVSMPVLEW